MAQSKMISIILNLFRLGFVIIFHGTFFSYISMLVSTDENMQKRRAAFAKNLTKALQIMGPSFIKFGQFLSTRPDLIGNDISDALCLLQDKLPPFSKKELLKTLKKELGKNPDEIYKTIDYTPIAAASIAQVHRAFTYEGEEVAVKVLRPNIEALFERDIKLFTFIAKLIMIFAPSLRRLRLTDAVDTMSKSMNMELDLRIEAASADQLLANTIEDKNVYVPKIYWQLTTKRVLTVEWITGIPISNKDELIKAGINIDMVIKNLSISFFNQAFKTGFFHADLHPGNILVMENGNIAFVDFGIMGHLDKRNKLFIAHMLYSFINRDYIKVSDLHFEIGYIPETESREHFALACRSIGEPIIGVDSDKISIGLLMKQLFSVSHNFNMPMQPQLILLQKTIVTVEGICASLDNTVNIWKVIEPWIKEWGKSNFAIHKKIYNSYEKSADLVHQVNSIVRKAIDSRITPKPDYSYSKYIYIAVIAFIAGVLIRF